MKTIREETKDILRQQGRSETIVRRHDLIDSPCIGVVDSWAAFALADVPRPHELAAEVVTQKVHDDTGEVLVFSLYARPAA